MFKTLFLLILSIFSLLFISFIHELGHYTFAKVFHFIVPEFGIGIGKTLLKIKDKNETEWKLNIFPIVSYVKIAGMEKKDLHTKNGYFTKPIYQRFLTIFGGPLFNLILAILIFFLLFFFNGYQSNIVSSSAIPQLKPNDKIISVNGNAVSDYSDISKYFFIYHNKIELTVQRDGKDLTENINFSANNIIFKPKNIKSSPLITIKETWNFFKNYTVLFFYAILDLFSKQPVIPASKALVSPIGLMVIMVEYLKNNLFILIPLTGIISFALGLTNLFPIPALDGFWIVLLFFEKLFKIKPKQVVAIQEIGYIVLLILSGLLIIKDIYFFFII